MEEGVVWYPDQGTPQGGVISPLLSNIFLHEVLDVWFQQTVQPRMKGRTFMVRFADDAVLGFEREDDARRVFEVLPKRFGKYGLTLHPEKTQLVDFRRPRRLGKRASGQSFDMLGFTHYWGKSRKGQWVVKRENGQRPLQPCGNAHRPMVPDQPALVRGGTTDGPQPEATRSLQLLWSDW